MTTLHAFWAIFIAPFAEFAFMRRALVATLALSLSAAPLGVFLSLRRMSLLGDALSHAILPGVAIGFMCFGVSLTAMALGGGSRMKGMPAPRVIASHRMRIQAPKMAGISNLSVVRPKAELARMSERMVTQRHARSQAAAISRK